MSCEFILSIYLPDSGQQHKTLKVSIAIRPHQPSALDDLLLINSSMSKC